ncbi:MAG TPA: hypothetical protein VFV65_03670 [Gemmatimonadales bacterium]|nr:hypothetical protein [Gemmatimonadales bacterium]
MSAIVVWALFTGGITGAIWAGVLLTGHLKKLAKQQLFLLAQLEDRLDQVDALEQRLGEVEGRLEFAERVLAAAEPARRPDALPPGPPGA